MIAQRPRLSDSRAARALAVLFGSLIGLVAVLVADFLVSRLSNASSQIAQTRYVSTSDGWYELAPNYAGKHQFGPVIFDVETDAHGFRKKPGAATPSAYDVIAIGDSFTYGINGGWEQTFVGMYADDSRRHVLNAGVSSYSPTAYLHQYRKALSLNLLSRPHLLLVAVDLSDVMDEAGIWIDGDANPRRRPPFGAPTASAGAALAPDAAAAIHAGGPPQRRPTRADIADGLIAMFPHSWRAYRFVRYDVLRWHASILSTHPRSAFTHMDWATLDARPAAPLLEGYAPLGVRGGLSKLETKMLNLMTTATQAGGTVYILVYPWPAQMMHADTFSWSDFIAALCTRGACAGVVDTIPTFRRIAAEDPGWLGRLYVKGDTHFSREGNRVIADALLQSLPRR